jgi:hypothetical protein
MWEAIRIRDLAQQADGHCDNRQNTHGTPQTSERHLKRGRQSRASETLHRIYRQLQREVYRKASLAKEQALNLVMAFIEGEAEEDMKLELLNILFRASDPKGYYTETATDTQVALLVTNLSLAGASLDLFRARHDYKADPEPADIAVYAASQLAAYHEGNTAGNVGAGRHFHATAGRPRTERSRVDSLIEALRQCRPHRLQIQEAMRKENFCFYAIGDGPAPLTRAATIARFLTAKDLREVRSSVELNDQFTATLFGELAKPMFKIIMSLTNRDGSLIVIPIMPQWSRR